MIKDIKLFGSFKRDNILPREVDPDSDVDVMVIFKDAFRTPKETFYDLLLQFARENYGEQILKDEPSIVLNLSGSWCRKGCINQSADTYSQQSVS